MMENKDSMLICECCVCGRAFQEGEKFCPLCGAEPVQLELVFDDDFKLEDFEPDNNIMECIYGPPPCDYSFKCKSCGYFWTESLMYVERDACPKCGNHDICISEDDNALININIEDI